MSKQGLMITLTAVLVSVPAWAEQPMSADHAGMMEQECKEAKPMPRHSHAVDKGNIPSSAVEPKEKCAREKHPEHEHGIEKGVVPPHTESK